MNDNKKYALFSSIFMSGLVLFIIGLEPFIPEIAAVLPDNLSTAVSVILPIVIMVARKYGVNNDIKIVPQLKDKDDVK